MPKLKAELQEILMRQRKGNVFFIVALASVFGVATGSAQQRERTTPISAPTTPLTSEAASRGVTKFSLIAYGDTRGRRDGKEIQYEHSLVIDSMLAQIRKLQTTDYPVKFVLQSGDAVQNGKDVNQWNISFVPLIDRLTTEGGVPYFLVPGNHEATTTEEGMRNYLDAVRKSGVEMMAPPGAAPSPALQ